MTRNVWVWSPEPRSPSRPHVHHVVTNQSLKCLRILLKKSKSIRATFISYCPRSPRWKLTANAQWTGRGSRTEKGPAQSERIRPHPHQWAAQGGEATEAFSPAVKLGGAPQLSRKAQKHREAYRRERAPVPHHLQLTSGSLPSQSIR